MNDLLPVLVIEDERFLLSYFQSALERGGVRTVGASSGSEALDLLQRGEFAAIVSDLRLTGAIDGAEIFEWVRRHRPELSHRFLFVTGDLHAPSAAEVRERTGAIFLEKPFRPGQMVEMVKKMMSRGETVYVC
jgi:two-component system, cell cycle response regulator DivK